MQPFSNNQRVRVSAEDHPCYGKTGRVVRLRRGDNCAFVRMDEPPPIELRSFPDSARGPKLRGSLQKGSALGNPRGRKPPRTKSLRDQSGIIIAALLSASLNSSRPEVSDTSQNLDSSLRACIGKTQNRDPNALFSHSGSRSTAPELRALYLPDQRFGSC